MPYRIAVALLFCAELLPAQRILYNQARDKSAQNTLDAARQITSASVVTTQLKNLEQIEKDLIENEVAWTETSLKRNLNAFRTWASAQMVVNTAKCLIQWIRLPTRRRNWSSVKKRSPLRYASCAQRWRCRRRRTNRP